MYKNPQRSTTELARKLALAAAPATLVLSVTACGDVADGPSGSRLMLEAPTTSGSAGATATPTDPTAPTSPAVPSTVGGDINLADPVERGEDVPVVPAVNCDPNFTGVVRDFQFSHPDFEAFAGGGVSEGIVANDLGADGKPVFNTASPNMVAGAYEHPQYGRQVTSQQTFDQWYRTTDGVNQEILFTLPLAGQQGRLVYDNTAFFPIDGEGFGNETENHNFAFTFELHTTFTYQGGEVFTFVGDDDLWAFINGKLAVDVGGLHPQQTRSVDLDMVKDQLGIVLGESYPLDLFHAERHTGESNFHVETNIVFTNCDPIFTPDVLR